MRKRWLALALAGAMVVGGCGCERKVEVTTPAPTAAPDPLPMSTAKRDAAEVYQELLTRLYEEHIDPDPEFGRYTDEVWETLGQIEFAVCDVDMDGERELIMRHAHDMVAGQYTAVYRYDGEKGELANEVYGTASCRFYDNGMMQDDISHNQGGWSWEFWPYTVLQYDEGTKMYREVGHVSAWEKACFEKYGFEFPKYPEEADVDKAGIVYYIGEDDPVSQSAYDAWYTETFGKEILVDYYPLTEENVKRLRELAAETRGSVDPTVEWLDEGLWEELTPRQQKLLENLPAGKLPKEAAEWRDTREVWENTLVPMCYDEKNDVTVYTVTEENSVAEFQNGGYWYNAAGIVLRVGEKTKYYPIGHCQGWVGSNPLMVVKDLDGDGKDEAAVSFFSGHGTGVGISILYIFDLETLEYETMDFSGVTLYARYDPEENTVALRSGDEEVRVTLPEWPEGQTYRGAYAGYVNQYWEKDGKLMCTFAVDFSGCMLWYLAAATGEVVYEDGRYTLGPLTLETLE